MLLILLILTQSVSGIVGSLLALLLIVVFGDLYKYKNFMYSLFLISFFIFLVPFVYDYSSRLIMYSIEAKNLFTNLENNVVTDLIYLQSPDIIPVWSYFNQIRDLDIFSVLLGSGSGSPSYVVNEYLSAEQTVNNPRSNFVRIIYSSGLIGMFFYLKFLISPIKNLIMNIESRNKIFILYSSLFLFGCTLGQRSFLGFIFVGIVISILVNNLYEKNSKKE